MSKFGCVDRFLDDEREFIEKEENQKSFVKIWRVNFESSKELGKEKIYAYFVSEDKAKLFHSIVSESLDNSQIEEATLCASDINWIKKG